MLSFDGEKAKPWHLAPSRLDSEASREFPRHNSVMSEQTSSLGENKRIESHEIELHKRTNERTNERTNAQLHAAGAA